MKKQLIYLTLLVATIFASCKSTSNDPTPTPLPTSNVVEVTGDIKTSTTWSADKIYLLKGFVYVIDGATLTIEPGTIIKGDKVSKGSLVITRGSKINASGTVDKPIVFTSNQPAGSRSTGDWGGLIILGKALVNQGEVIIEGGLTPTTGTDAAAKAKYTTYGGTDIADNSGTLKYVRFEYGGVPFAPDNEINGLTLGGVGSGTTMDYIEVYRAGDDSIEWFGGSVNAKHLLSIGALDDDFDTDFGFSGNVQYALAQRYPTIADVSGSNGFESDNDGNGSNLTPVTSCTFSNVTIIGPRWAAANINANYQHAAQIRRSSSLSAYNSMFVDCVEGVYIDDTKIVAGGVKTSDRLLGANPTLFFKNNLIYNCNSKTTQIKADATILAALTTKFSTDGNVVDAALKGSDVMVDPYKLSSDFASAGTPNFLGKGTALTGAAFTDAKVSGSFFDKVTFRGAFDATTNWTAGWASFDPQSLPYTTPGAVK